MLNPVGPEQPSTYWRRRAVVVAALLVVLWLAWWLLSAALGSGDAPDPEPSGSPSAGMVSPTPQPVPSASTQAGPSSPVAAASPAASSGPAACAKSVVSVATELSGSSTDAGEGLVVTMAVTNTGDEACRRDVGPGANEVTISSGSVLVWSSDFCNESDRRDRVTLAPGGVFRTSVTWPGRVTGRSCPATQPVAQPGTYRAVARNLAVESEPVTFAVQ